jgi:hypothetical protein
MHVHLQNIIVFAVIAAAAFYLARRMARSAQGHSDGACGKCACGDKKSGS